MHGARTRVSSAKCWRGLVAIGVPRPRSLLLGGASGLADTSNANTVAIVAIVAVVAGGADGCDDYAQRCPARRTIRRVRQRLPLAPG